MKKDCALSYADLLSHTSLLFLQSVLELAVLYAVEEINDQAGEEPGAEPEPGPLGQAVHEVETEPDRDQRREGHPRGFEFPLHFGPGLSQDDDPDRDEDEGEQGADVAEVDDHRQREKAGDQSGYCPGDPGTDMRSLVDAVDPGEGGGKEAVPGHDHEDPDLPVQGDEKGRNN